MNTLSIKSYKEISMGFTYVNSGHSYSTPNFLDNNFNFLYVEGNNSVYTATNFALMHPVVNGRI